MKPAVSIKNMEASQWIHCSNNKNLFAAPFSGVNTHMDELVFSTVQHTIKSQLRKYESYMIKVSNFHHAPQRTTCTRQRAWPKGFDQSITVRNALAQRTMRRVTREPPLTTDSVAGYIGTWCKCI